MITQLSHQRPHPRTATRRAGARTRRLTTVLATVIVGLLASVAVVPAAFANPIPVGEGGTAPTAPVPATTIHVLSTGGLASWQITLIALGAALLAAAAAVLLDRKLAARRSASATTA
jgi:hypothetical protein